MVIIQYIVTVSNRMSHVPDCPQDTLPSRCSPLRRAIDSHRKTLQEASVKARMRRSALVAQRTCTINIIRFAMNTSLVLRFAITLPALDKAKQEASVKARMPTIRDHTKVLKFDEKIIIKIKTVYTKFKRYHFHFGLRFSRNWSGKNR